MQKSALVRAHQYSIAAEWCEEGTNEEDTNNPALHATAAKHLSEASSLYLEASSVVSGDPDLTQWRDYLRHIAAHHETRCARHIM